MQIRVIRGENTNTFPLNFVTLGLLIVKLQTKYNESGNKKSGTKSTLE